MPNYENKTACKGCGQLEGIAAYDSQLWDLYSRIDDSRSHREGLAFTSADLDGHRLERAGSYDDGLDDARADETNDAREWASRVDSDTLAAMLSADPVGSGPYGRAARVEWDRRNNDATTNDDERGTMHNDNDTTRKTVPMFEESTSPLYMSNDGRVKVETDPDIERPFSFLIVVDNVPVWRTASRVLVDAFIAGWDARNDATDDELRAEVKAALEGDSNDAEHDALSSVADRFGIEWTEDRADDATDDDNDAGTVCYR